MTTSSEHAHEHERISAYLDGRLDLSERAELEAHLDACPGCRDVTEALAATLDDLGALEADESGEVPEQVRWAVRTAVARARRPLLRRAVPLASGAAAAMVAFVAVGLAMFAGGETGPPIAADAPESLDALEGFPVIDSGRDYDPEGIDALARSLAVAGGPASQPEGDPPADESAPDSFALDRGTREPLRFQPSTVAQRCAEKIQAADDDSLVPRHFESAYFRGRAALLLAFERRGRIEIWVMDTRTCDTLHWAQRRTT